MTENWEYIRKRYDRELRREIRRIIASACGCAGENYKLKVPLEELINYKINKSYSYRNVNKDNIKFEKFVSAIDNIVNGVKARCPFIDLTGLDLTWTPEQIIDLVSEAYANISVITLDKIKKKIKKTSC